MDEKIWIAFGAASSALLMVLRPRDAWGNVEPAPAVDGTAWPFMGDMPEAIGQAREAGGYAAYEAAFMERIAPLVDFVRGNPEAPLEALYRHAAGRGVHDRPADGFDDIEPAFRIAYAVFRSTLLEADRVFAEEEARAAAKARAAAVQPPVIVPLEDTILAQHSSIFDRIGDRPETVNLGGPVPAASTEGEGGDAGQNVVEGPGAGPNDDGAPALAAGIPGVDGAVENEPGVVAGAGAARAEPSADGDAGGVSGEAGEGEARGDADGAASGDAPADPAGDTDGAPPAPVKPRKK